MSTSGGSGRAGRTVRTRLPGRLATALVACAAGVLGTLAVGPVPALAAVVTDCTPDGTVGIGGGAYVYRQNVRATGGAQCAQVDDEVGEFTLTSTDFNLPTNGAAATYPSLLRGCHQGTCSGDSGLPIRTDEIGSATTSWDTTPVDAGAYATTYVLWFNSTPETTARPDGTELRIWLNNRGGIQPAGVKVTTATVAGKQWDVWIGQKIITYVLTQAAATVNGLDAKAVIDDAVTRGSVDPAHYLLSAEAGFEIWVGGQGLTSKSFSFDVSRTTGPLGRSR